VQPSEDPNKPHDTTLEIATEDCRICVVRRREIVNGLPSFSSSIWGFSDDLSVRFQQKREISQLHYNCCLILTYFPVPENQEIIPFASYFQDEKISITFPTDVVLHDIAFGTPPLKTQKTSWVNYVFEDAACKSPTILSILSRQTKKGHLNLTVP